VAFYLRSNRPWRQRVRSSRGLILINLLLGLATVIVGGSGRFWG
jgi:hypothetical protein